MPRGVPDFKDPSGNPEGFSLIEVIVALFIGGIIASGAASLVSLSVKSNRNVAMIGDNSELTSVAQQLLTDPNTCTLNLAGQKIDTLTFAEKKIDLTYPKMDPADPLQLVKGDPVVQDHRFGKIEVEDVTLLPHAQVSADVWLVALRVRTRKVGEYLGASSSLNDVIAHVKIDPGSSEIQNCVPTRELASVQAEDIVVNEKICALGTGGAKLYDSNGKLCSLPNPLAPTPTPVPSSGPVVLNEALCNLASGGTRSYDPATQKCADRSVFRVKAVDLRCECPPSSALWWIEAALIGVTIPPQYCVQFGAGDQTCANYASGGDGGGPNKGRCIFAPEIDLALVPPQNIICNCVCLGGVVAPAPSPTP